MKIYIVLFLILLQGCTEPPHSLPNSHWQEIQDRTHQVRYRVKTPNSWVRTNPKTTDNLSDTTLALCEFTILEGNDKIRITIHDFPFQQPDQRIPLMAQVRRWQSQLQNIDMATLSLNEESHGGYIGLSFEGEGLMKGTRVKVMGWSMQLAPEYVQRMDGQPTSDYTIKIVGPPDVVNQYRKSLTTFANSFELIQELPSLL